MRRTSRRRLYACAALLAAYAAWLFFGDSPLTRAQGAAGRLPELSPGFPVGEPAATLSKLGDARGDYLWLQAFDLLSAALIAMAALFSASLAAQRLSVSVSAARTFIAVPMAFAGAEIIENLLLALFASGAISPSAPLAFFQQAATNVKLGLGAFTSLFALSLIAALVSARPARRPLP